MSRVSNFIRENLREAAFLLCVSPSALNEPQEVKVFGIIAGCALWVADVIIRKREGK